MRIIKLVTRFYSEIFLANFLVTLSCIAGMHAHKITGILFLFKIISIGLIFYIAIHYKKKELYYYQNLGISKLMLGLTTSLFDFLLWLIISIIAYQAQ
jgi:hypothetical protein